MSATQRIATANDAFRRNMFVKIELGKTETQRPNGIITVSAGVHHLPPDDKARVLVAVKNFNDFNADNNPYGEREFGSIELAGIPPVFWRIAYYEDETMQFGAEAPEVQCFRLLSIYLAEEH